MMRKKNFITNANLNFSRIEKNKRVQKYDLKLIGKHTRNTLQVGSLNSHRSVSLQEITFIEMPKYPQRTNTLMVFPTRKRDSILPMHILLISRNSVQKPIVLNSKVIFLISAIAFRCAFGTGLNVRKQKKQNRIERKKKSPELKPIKLNAVIVFAIVNLMASMSVACTMN